MGGVRPQNFDVGYRPDGVRVAFDSKTLNDAKSIGKNWQNMINDLATEATTVHSRFPPNGQINAQWPDANSPIRIERFSEKVELAYVTRYKGLPPHAAE